LGTGLSNERRKCHLAGGSAKSDPLMAAFNAIALMMSTTRGRRETTLHSAPIKACILQRIPIGEPPSTTTFCPVTLSALQ
jgi:hypothetical protein